MKFSSGTILYDFIFIILWIDIVFSLEDDVKFDFNWLGPLPNNEYISSHKPSDVIDLKTVNNENYKCLLPELQPNENDKKPLTDLYMPVLNLIQPLYAKKICSYRIESYWIYELCHGQYIRQYHETKQSGKRVIPEEYYLGYFDESKQDKEYIEENGIKKTRIDWKMIDGKRVPAFSVSYTDGTNCAIVSNKPRQTIVFYICDQNGNENVISFEEISSCTYEMVVSTKILCSHTSFQPMKFSNKQIECYTNDDKSNVKPKDLINFELETELSKSSRNKIIMTHHDGSEFIIKVRRLDEVNGDDDENDEIDSELNENEKLKTYKNTEITPPNESPSSVSNTNQQNLIPQYSEKGSVDSIADKDVINSFISGSYCLKGGVGWWKYEICYGKHIKQYHDDETSGARLSIILGKWNENSHIEWLKQNPHKKPSKIQERGYVNLYFGDGDFCERSNKARFVEVKLKCDKTKERSLHAISFYILEPLVCEYLLVVESPLLCKLIANSDENGLFKQIES